MLENNLKKLGKNIKHVRLSKKLSQESLAELIGKSRNYIGMIERAECNVPAKTIFELANALNIHPKEFFDF